MATGREPRRTVYFQASGGRHYVMNTRTKRLTRVLPRDMGEARRIWGDPITRRGDLPRSVRIGGRQGRPVALHLLKRRHNTRLNPKNLRQLFGGRHGIERYIAGRKRDPFTGSNNFNQRPVRSEEGNTIYAPSMFRGNDAMGYVRSTLSPYGLDTPQLRRLVSGLIETGSSSTEIFAQLRKTDEWKERFKGNVQRRQAGLPELTPDRYVQMEEQMREILTVAGVPQGFRDSNDDFAEWIGAGMSPQLLADRINRGVRQVLSAPPEVREALDEMLPGEGNQAMLAFMLDPDKATGFIEKRFMHAQAEGTFAQAGIELGGEGALGRAPGLPRNQIVDRAIQLGLSPDEFQRALGETTDQLGQSEALFRESVGEAEDLEAGNEGALALLGGDADAARAIEERRQTRLATQAGTGGATATNEGLSF